MIFGQLNNMDSFNFLDEKIKRCLEFAIENDLSEMKNGKYHIDDDIIFLNLSEYETKSKNKRFWEAHKLYIDIHVVVSGIEKIKLGFVSNMKKGDYNEDTDFLEISGNGNGEVTLTKDDFLICYPNDGHMTALIPEKGESETIKKGIFKVKY